MVIDAPPYDSDGNVKQHNHKQILDSDQIIRRITHKWVKTDLDGNKYVMNYAYQPSSDPGGGMSVDHKRWIEDDGIKAEDFVTNDRWIGSILFVVGAVRNVGAGYKVGYDPIYGDPAHNEPDNPYHCEVWGSFSKSEIKELKKLPLWFVQIPNCEISSP